eukprot:scaffold316_cov146-Skeletonema_marinoi.AAC.1
MDRFISNKYETTIDESIRADFFNRGRKIHGTNIAKFRATVKVHKLPAQKLRPVIAKCGRPSGPRSEWSATCNFGVPEVPYPYRW